MKIVKSPLRYPGSKQKFCDTFYKVLYNNNIKPKIFIEPFAGGASISLFMLQNGLADKIVLIEKDSLLASFWKTVFFDSDWLIKEIQKLSINVDTWIYFKNYNPRSIRKKALKCLFMNRTCFSGILKAGPLGGMNQKSNYKIDCRFNKNTIIDTISHLSKYKDKILLIEEGDYKDILEKRIDLINKDTFIYFDPPYVNKAKGLYNHFFYDDDHLDLKYIIEKINCNWLLSYDYEPSLNNLYLEFSNCGFFDIRYSITSNNNRPQKKEFLATNLELNF